MPFKLYHRTKDDRDFLPVTASMREKADDAASNWTEILLDVQPIAKKISGRGDGERYAISRGDLRDGIRDAILEALTNPY